MHGTLAKPPLLITGMFGIGDNIAQRAMLRELMKTHEVWLETYYVTMYHDLVAQGLKLKLLPSRSYTPQLEPAYRNYRSSNPPPNAERRRLTYHPENCRTHGSIPAAQCASLGIPVPEKFDYTIPVLDGWREKARKLIGQQHKPLMVLRQNVVNQIWHNMSRAPDPAAFTALFNSIRECFYVVSVANFRAGNERVVGQELDCDRRLHDGLDFETLAGLFAEAKLVFTGPGMGSLLSTAVGTPTIVVYGGYEEHAVTPQGSATFDAPILAIDPDKPCACWKNGHACNKHITLEPALAKVKSFVDEHCRGGTLIFGTAFCDTAEKIDLLNKWEKSVRRLNPGADVLIVQTPQVRMAGKSPFSIGQRGGGKFIFADNIGHLARGGQDGWWRAFRFGLDAAVAGGYEYVAAIECDSLFRKPIAPIIDKMKRDLTPVAAAEITGMKLGQKGFVETGLMLFETKWIEQSRFRERYEAIKKDRSVYPENVVKQLAMPSLAFLDVKAIRSDRDQVTADNCLEYDWITHCKDHRAYERFFAAIHETSLGGLRVNLGCGSNRLDGWSNHDADVDITKRLPWKDGQASYVFAEHVVEHVTFDQALEFFRECRRILMNGGVLRIAVPSIERVWKNGDPEYWKFTTKWQPHATARGAMHSILRCHGHKAPWTDSLLESALYLAGFENLTSCAPGRSSHSALRGVEGHHKVIGERFNAIESSIWEAE